MCQHEQQLLDQRPHPGAHPGAGVHPGVGLTRLYEASSMQLPRFDWLDGQAMPEPYRSLLVHERDMTPTLEAYHKQLLSLHVLHIQQSDSAVRRLVVLVGDRDNKIAEFGAIEINLEPFDDAARQLIRQSRRPLGAILRDAKIEHISKPRAYFSVKADAMMEQAFGQACGVQLFGRHNCLYLPQGELLAEVIEILPRAAAGR